MILQLLPAFFFGLFHWEAFCSDAKVKSVLRGQVIKVSEGDVLFLKTKKATYKIKLAEIDAPELIQPFGKESLHFLSQAILNKSIHAECTAKEKSGVYLCYALLNNRNLNLEMVRNGLAWVTPSQNSLNSYFNEIEQIAREEKSGLWSQESPTQPWLFRKNQEKIKNAQKISQPALTPKQKKKRIIKMSF